MNPLKDKQLSYWLVNLGNMYYAGGLLRKKEDESTFSYEFVNDETYAFPFLKKAWRYEDSRKMWWNCCRSYCYQ
nr:hypothetical protein GGBNIMDK_00158 [Bacillus cereus]